MSDADSGGDDWEPEPASLRDGETPDESSHASRMTEQRKQILEDDSLPEDVRERVRAKIDDAHEDLEDDDVE